MSHRSAEAVVLAIAAVLSACSASKSGTPGSGGAVRVTGSYAAAAALAAGPAAAAAPLAAGADRVVAVPMQRGWLTPQLMSWSVSAPLSGGAFALDLSKDYDWLLLLVDSAAAGEARFQGAVNLRTALDAGLIDLPISDAAVDAIAVGTVQAALGGDATSVSSIAANLFRLTPGQLEALARSDDLFKNAKNLVNNYGTFGNGPGVYYSIRPDFSWEGESDLTTTSSDPANLRYLGMTFQLGTNSPSLSMDALCSHATVVTLEPPVDVTVSGFGGPLSFGPANPLTTAGAVCSPISRGGAGAREFWSGPFYGSNAPGTLTFSAGRFDANPAGYWTWREGTTVRARFDVSSVSPPLDVNGKPAGFIPAFQVNTAADGRITSIDVRWYGYDRGTGAYTLVAPADLGLLAHYVAVAEVVLDRSYGGARRTESLPIDPATTSRVVPAQTWYYGRHPADPSAETGLMGFYETAGFGFFFHFRPALTP
jgi:hypothetical protein